MWFDFLVFKTEELEIAGEKCPPKSISERPQFTCFQSGLKNALSKLSCFDLHEVNEKRKNILIDYCSQVPGGFGFDFLHQCLYLILPFYSDIFTRLMATSVFVHHSSLKENHGWAFSKDLNETLPRWTKKQNFDSPKKDCSVYSLTDFSFPKCTCPQTSHYLLNRLK